MENKLQIFKNEQFGQIRIVESNGKKYFGATDSAKALGYKNQSDAIITHCKKDGVAIHEVIDSMGRLQKMNFITEGNLYRLISKSQLPTAEKFESWIFDEVLPQIRQTGGYIPSNENDSDEDILAKALLIANKKIELKNNVIKDKDRQLILQQPKVVFADAVSASHNSILVGDLAKILKQNGIDTGANRLFERLRKEGYLIKRKGTDYNMPTQYSMELELFEVKETSISHSDGHISISRTPKVTGKGQLYFVNKYLKELAESEVACTKYKN